LYFSAEGTGVVACRVFGPEVDGSFSPAEIFSTDNIFSIQQPENISPDFLLKEEICKRYRLHSSPQDVI
jgi:hypothetical protein